MTNEMANAHALDSNPAQPPAQPAAPDPSADGGGGGEALRKGIYVASKTIHAAMWREHREQGQPIISSWIDEAGEGQSSDLVDLWKRCIGEAENAGAVILYHDHRDTPLKGALVEVGAALAKGVPVYVVSDAVPLLGSFTNHPLVSVCNRVEHAFIRAHLTIGLASRTPALGAAPDPVNRAAACPCCKDCGASDHPTARVCACCGRAPDSTNRPVGVKALREAAERVTEAFAHDHLQADDEIGFEVMTRLYAAVAASAVDDADGDAGGEVGS